MNMESEASQSISLNILVEKEKNRVVFVESNKDFVDIIFSFMTMPIGTIIRLTRERSLKGEIGCLKNLYESVENLDEEHFKSEFKEIILDPRSAAEIYCRNLKLNLNESKSGKYYVCDSGNCSFVSYTKTDCCRCGKPLELEARLLSLAHEDGAVFVKPTTRFMITDDFQVLPMSTMTGLSLLSKLGAMDESKIEERTLNIGKDEVLKLLNYSLASRTPFSDTFMEPPINKTNVVIHRGEYGPRSTDQPQSNMDTTAKHSKINLKLIIHKSNKRALYAEVEENFIELLCSLLVLPIGFVFKEFPSLRFKGCMDNIYKSIQDFDDDKFFQSEEMKAILVDPKLAQGLAFSNKLIGIEEAMNPSLSTLSSLFTTRYTRLSSKSPPGEAKISGGFMKGPSMFMVTDNLLIKPISPISGISLINRLKVPLSDVGELEVTMGENEVLRLLVASLISGSALTNAFKSFMHKELKQEP
ncbi:uncharacterized protein LOC114296809 [Camellia sinensis]|uniref:DUF674 family protein n=1 Tax=Camellia sinensis var. sinensis TaxID=542762 RepID=A0A4S4DCM6_CAMSN|nr:uncharacterized protein LOC114296809 [Camellia sinensis]THG00363.1 hypothetical protein TEA_000553 [Camellia sinensis var. sinensis]